LLALLAGNVTASEIMAALAQMEADAETDEDLTEITDLGRLVLELHSARIEDRWRARGLTLLTDTARDLATHRNVDELLLEICRRARLLLGTDVAYVTLLDDVRGDSFVKATDGVISEHFQAMRIPLGTGLGGLVANTGTPETTADYREDARLAHSKDVDERVASEGLRGIVAVPLKRQTDVIGVLMSGSREARHFDPAEVALFASLGSHAAVALETARLMQQSEVMLADLSQAHTTVKEHARRIERVGEIHDRLTALVLSGSTILELLQALVQELPGEIEMRGPDGTTLEKVGSDEPAGDLEHITEAPVLARAQRLGTLRMRRSRQDAIETEALQRAAILVAGMLLSQQRQTEADHRHRSMVLEDLLAGPISSTGDLQRRAAQEGITLETEHTVLAVDPPESAKRWAWLHATQVAQSRHAIVGVVRGHIIVIEPTTESRSVAAAWSSAMADASGTRATIGAAGGAVGIEALRAAHGYATQTLSLLRALGRHGEYATITDLGIFGHMLSSAGEGDLRAFEERALGRLRAYDTERHSELIPTLKAFFAEGGHLANTARSLDIHINTLYQRLVRIDRLLGAGWRAGDQRLELQLAIRLDDLEGLLNNQAS
jgi:sugar diacid utilization regulator